MNLDIKKECNNVMVIVPHQDDEILMSAGVIRVCEQNNVPYTVVMVTNGDYGCIDYSKGYARLKESLAGLKNHLKLWGMQILECRKGKAF